MGLHSWAKLKKILDIISRTFMIRNLFVIFASRGFYNPQYTKTQRNRQIL